MTILQGIAHVNLTMAPGPQALASARRFYIGLLELEELDRPADIDGGQPGYWLACGTGQQIHLSTEEGAENYNGPSKRHAAFVVSNLAGLRRRLEQANVPVQEAEATPAGLSRFFARDPWGNRLEFMEWKSPVAG